MGIIAMISEEVRKKLLNAQKSEISEHYIYKKLSKTIKGKHNKDILKKISDDELKHYGIWKKYTGKDVKPSWLMVWKYYLLSRIFGVTFGLKLMEKGEEKAQSNYSRLNLPEAKIINQDESRHEEKLVGLLDEEKLKYIGSVVLGLNDALVELTGALAGFTLALQNPKLVATAGLVTGIAASFSMGASEYLSKRAEEKEKISPIKASVYTGIAYILTVLLLIMPYLLLRNIYASLAWTLANALIVISVFTYYVSVAKDYSFKKKFLEMSAISLGVAGFSFGVGFLVRIFLGIEA
jgi:VIT1/CCC1 family predicted Fe2+/Mn2+ transporter